MAIDEKKLKPCPFCGYHAVAESGKARKGYDAIVSCNCCGAEYRSVYFDTIEEAENDAIESWNRRTSNWIPCSERLPEANQIVMCSVKKEYAYHRIVLQRFTNEEYWHNGIVEAWMPLPEPYKGEGA